jgi:1-deoxy-D-xylulose-5-phosphate synthase
LKETGVADTTDYSTLFKNEVTQVGSEVALMGLGNFYGLAQAVAATLAEQHGIHATVINPKFISGLDHALLDSLADNHKVVVTLEDGALDGGYGQTVAGYLGNSELLVQNYGLDKAFHDRYDAAELLAESGITVDNIVKNVLKSLGK